jgi:hypothetical protein
MVELLVNVTTPFGIHTNGVVLKSTVGLGFTTTLVVAVDVQLFTLTVTI